MAGLSVSYRIWPLKLGYSQTALLIMLVIWVWKTLYGSESHPTASKFELLFCHSVANGGVPGTSATC